MLGYVSKMPTSADTAVFHCELFGNNLLGGFNNPALLLFKTMYTDSVCHRPGYWSINLYTVYRTFSYQLFRRVFRYIHFLVFTTSRNLFMTHCTHDITIFKVA